MKRLIGFFVLCSLTTPPLAAQAVSPNVARGFDADKAYAVGELDVVSLFNGNVNVPIPLGPRYSVGPLVSYQFAAQYGGNSWEFQSRDAQVAEGQWVTYWFGFPSRHDNAGFGWRLHFGRLLTTEDSGCQAPDASFTATAGYESPDGAVHCFYPTLHAYKYSESVAGYFYTRDGSYLRMQIKDGQKKDIHFPDGTVHEFDLAVAPGVLKISDRPSGATASNSVSFEYNVTVPDDIAGAPVWRINDSYGRQHYVYFKPSPPIIEHGLVSVPHSVVAEVRLDSGPTMVFTYYGDGGSSWATLPRVWPDGEPLDPDVGTTVKIALLNKITMPEGEFAFDYDRTGSFECTGCVGILTSAVVPTLARFTWTYENRYYPENSAALWDGVKGGPHYAISSAVKLREIHGALRAGESTPRLISRRTYTQSDDGAYNVLPAVPMRERRLVITDFDGDGATILRKSEHFFSVCVPNCSTMPPMAHGDYALPYSKKPRTNPPSTDGEGRYLSSIEYGPGSNWTEILRRHYVGYEADVDLATSAVGITDLNRRQFGQRTYYDDDPMPGGASHFVGSVQTEFDGLGHYRRATTTSSFGSPRSTYTTLNAARGTFPQAFSMVPTGDRWILGMAGSTEVVESGEKQLVEMHHDSATGNLLRRRVLKDLANGTRSSSDLISVFEYDVLGNVIKASNYGGDDNPDVVGSEAVGTANLHLATLGRATAVTVYQPIGPLQTVARASYQDAGVFTSDVTVDLKSGLVTKSRDVAGVETTYTYDLAGRITEMRPPGRAVTKYAYTKASASNGAFQPPSVRVTQHPAADPAAAALTESVYVYDELGRMVTRRQKIAGHADLSEQRVTYNALHWKTFVSHLDAPAFNLGTATTYDALGRPLAVTAADGAQASFAYTGARKKVRTTYVATPASPAKRVDVQELYDSAGRLTAVTEPSGATTASQPNGADVATQYTYSADGGLRSVKMIGAEGVTQVRMFDRDGRGFLRWETHPESGMTSYVYDARGKVIFSERAAAGTRFDLKYSYDSAERLTSVRGRNPANPTLFRPIKEYAYGVDNAATPSDLRLGKLLTATRYNYPVPGLGTPNTITVTETYGYHDAAGRRTHRTTVVDFGSGMWNNYQQQREITQSVIYNDLDLPTDVIYPKCQGCGLPAQNPSRTARFAYQDGFLVDVPGSLSSITYWPNGMRHVTTHENGMTDVQTIDAATRIPRPAQLKSEPYSVCSVPVIVDQTRAATVSSSSPSTVLSVTVDATPAATFQWYTVSPQQDIPGATSSSYVASPSTTTTYGVRVVNACNQTESAPIRVGFGDCVAPWIASAKAVRNPATGTATLSATPGGTGPLTYRWYRVSDQFLMGTGATVQTGVISATTEFEVRVTHDCGTGSATQLVEVAIPLELDAASVRATKRAGAMLIDVTWTAVAGAAQYLVERRTGGAGWQEVATVSSAQFTDSAVSANTVYAYRVRLRWDSPPSNGDVASTLTFTPISAGSAPSGSHVTDILGAVNAVRAAVGWSAVGWSNILAASHALPAPGVAIHSDHIVALRLRMNEALHGLGVSVGSYTDDDPRLKAIKAQHMRELQERVQ